MENEKPQRAEAYYEPVVIPAEKTAANPGRTEGIFGIICAFIAVLYAPPFFGIAGIILGIRSLLKGAKIIGISAIMLSAVFMALGIMVSLGAMLEEMDDVGGAAGLIWDQLF